MCLIPRFNSYPVDPFGVPTVTTTGLRSINAVLRIVTHRLSALLTALRIEAGQAKCGQRVAYVKGASYGNK